MKADILDAFMILFPYFLILAFLFVFPYFVGKGLWKLGVKGKAHDFKEFYQSLLYLTSALYALFLVIKVLVWTWKG